jgi:hypothetical protein
MGIDPSSSSARAVMDKDPSHVCADDLGENPKSSGA